VAQLQKHVQTAEFRNGAIDEGQKLDTHGVGTGQREAGTRIAAIAVLLDSGGDADTGRRATWWPERSFANSARTTGQSAAIHG
jgi:hypothetical protein